MRNLTATLCLTLAVLLGSSGVCWSADLQKGRDAYKREDYATALKEWTPLAEQGDADAQYNLGFMYRIRFCVPLLRPRTPWCRHHELYFLGLNEWSDLRRKFHKSLVRK